MPDISRNASLHYQVTVTLDMDVNDFVATTFTSTVAKVAVVGKECINILSVIAGSTICTFIFEGVLNEASIVDKFVEQVKQSGLKDFKVLDVSVKPPEPKAKPTPTRRASTPGVASKKPPSKAASPAPQPRTASTAPAAPTVKGKVTKLAPPKTSPKSRSTVSRAKPPG
jgi:hypothetical protein